MWRTNTGHTTSGSGTLSIGVEGYGYEDSSITTSQKVTYNSYTTMGKARKLTIQHDSTGRWSNNFYVYLSGYESLSFSKQTFKVTLPPFPVYALNISAGTGSNITVNRISCAGGAGTGVLSAGTKKLYYGDILKVSFTPSANYSIVTHTVNNATFTSGNNHTVYKDATVAATATPLKSEIGATDAYIGSVSTITVTPYNPLYTHTITYSFVGLTGTIAEKTANTSIEWTIPAAFYAQIPNNQTGICTLNCTTYNGNTSLGSSSCELTVKTSSLSCEPTVLATVVDTNTTTQALTGDSSMLIRYMSTALCTLEATPRNSAIISSLSIAGNEVTGVTNNGVTTATRSYSSVDATSFSFVATDSRGYSTSVVRTPTIVDYINLTCNPILSRPTPSGNSIVLTFTGDIYRGSFGACSNTLTLQYRYKESDSSYGAWITVAPTNIEYGISSYRSSAAITLAEEFDYRLDYTFQVRAIDGGTVDDTVYTLSTVTKTIPVNRGIPICDWGENDFNFNVSVSIKENATLDKDLDVGGNFSTQGDASVQGELTISGHTLSDYPIETGVLESGVLAGFNYSKYKSGKIECWGEKEVTFNAPSSTLYTGMYRSIVSLDMSSVMDKIIYGACSYQSSGRIPYVCRNGANPGIAEIIILTPATFTQFTATIPLWIVGVCED